MLDLCKSIPDLSDCDSIVITGGGASLLHSYATVFKLLNQNPKMALFEINGYFSHIDVSMLDDLRNVHVVFSQDFGTEDPTHELDNRIVNALTGVNTWLVTWGSKAKRKRADELGIAHRTIFAKVSEARTSDEWRLVERESGTAMRRGGTLAVVLSAMPPHIKTIYAAGLDAIFTGDDSHVTGKKNSYARLASIIKPICDQMKIRPIY